MTFALEDFCEPLMENPSYYSKRMFGGLAVYCNDLMLFVLTESPGDREWRGETFDFDLWNGVLLCTSREHHTSLQQQWPALVSHPILGKWLYLPMQAEDFEGIYTELIEAAENKDPRLGIVPGQSKKQKKSKTKKKTSRKKH